MLRSRIIPCLLVQAGGLVKTRQFGHAKYVGDPINAVRIFNEKMVDELMVLDIDATVERREPDYRMIECLAAECRMPLCYGGGVSSAVQARRIMGLGVEKVALSAAAVARPALIAEVADQVGSQSVAVVLDVKKRLLGGYRVFTHNGRIEAKIAPKDLAREAVALGAGEIIINSIDQDGMMQGYDLDLARQVRAAISVPMTLLGGAGSVDNLVEATRALGIAGLAAGSMFVFKGQFRAVLISYLSPNDRARLQAEVAR